MFHKPVQFFIYKVRKPFSKRIRNFMIFLAFNVNLILILFQEIVFKVQINQGSEFIKQPL